jgi:hypothetical protein
VCSVSTTIRNVTQIEPLEMSPWGLGLSVG